MEDNQLLKFLEQLYSILDENGILDECINEALAKAIAHQLEIGLTIPESFLKAFDE